MQQVRSLILVEHGYAAWNCGKADDTHADTRLLSLVASGRSRKSSGWLVLMSQMNLGFERNLSKQVNRKTGEPSCGRLVGVAI